MTLDFCCGAKDEYMDSFSKPTVLATVATASSLSPDRITALIPLSFSLPISKTDYSGPNNKP